MLAATALFAALELIAVTNHAGHALEAYPLSLTNRVVILARTNGERIKVPLSAFPESEQQRLRAALGVEVVPELTTEQKSRLRLYWDFLKRNEALHKAGVVDDAAYEKRRQQYEAIIEKTAKRRDVK